jgi:hypothetical protein
MLELHQIIQLPGRDCCSKNNRGQIVASRNAGTAFRIIALIILMTLLEACASMPLATMWKLHSYSIKDLQTLNPADIRVAVKLPGNLEFEPNQTMLDVTLTPKDSKQEIIHEHAQLMLLNQGRFVPADVPVAGAGETWYLMKLDPAGLKSFQDFQQRLGPDVETRYDSFSFNAKIQLGNEKIPVGTHFELSVWLRLAKDEDYFALLKDAPVTFTQDSASHDSSSASH